MIVPIFAASLLAASAPPPPDPWFAEDKLKHFVASFVVSSLSVSGARLAGFDRPTSIRVGLGIGAGVGVLKEIRDVRVEGAFSYRDILWDIAGIAAAAAVVDAAR